MSHPSLQVVAQLTEEPGYAYHFNLLVYISGPPVRLRVLKNGEHDLKRAVTVVGPDLGNVSTDRWLILCEILGALIYIKGYIPVRILPSLLSQSFFSQKKFRISKEA